MSVYPIDLARLRRETRSTGGNFEAIAIRLDELMRLVNAAEDGAPLDGDTLECMAVVDALLGVLAPEEEG